MSDLDPSIDSPTDEQIQLKRANDTANAMKFITHLVVGGGGKIDNLVTALMRIAEEKPWLLAELFHKEYEVMNSKQKPEPDKQDERVVRFVELLTRELRGTPLDQRGKKIEHIKQYRVISDIGLKEAKDFIDHLYESVPPDAIPF